MNICVECIFLNREDAKKHLPLVWRCRMPREVGIDPVSGEKIQLGMLCRDKNRAGRCEDFTQCDHDKWVLEMMLGVKPVKKGFPWGVALGFMGGLLWLIVVRLLWEVQ